MLRTGSPSPFVVAELKFNAIDLAHHFQVTARDLVRVGNAIISQSIPKVFGFADVKQFSVRIVNQINTSTFGRIAEKLLAQPPVKRSRVWNEE